jgi:hypothetical protein
VFLYFGGAHATPHQPLPLQAGAPLGQRCSAGQRPQPPSADRPACRAIVRPMCNLCRLDKGQDHLRRYFKVTQDDIGNMPPLPGIFPDMMAPVIRTDGASSNGADGRVMEMMRWGMPTPPRISGPARSTAA